MAQDRQVILKGGADPTCGSGPSIGCSEYQLPGGRVFKRKLRVEIMNPAGPQACPIDWLDSFCMRSFTGRSAFDETLPVADGLLEASFRVDREALRHDLEDWLTRKFGGGRQLKVHLTEIEPPGTQPSS